MKALNQETGDNFTFINGDCVETLAAIPTRTIHYSIFSPPFASLYTYSNSERDFGNCASDESFFEHMGFLIDELYRVLIPGRLVSFHCMNLPLSKQRDGEIGIKDFRGQLIAAFVNAGFIFHSEVCIWKDPVTAMQRTKALGLLHKQVLKDSCMSRQGIPDYLVTMRKPGDNPERVSGPFKNYVGDEGTGPIDISATCPKCGGTGKFKNQHDPEDDSDYDCTCKTTDQKTRFSIDVWQRYASPVWMDINPSNTLQRESAREENDERHICHLQLQVIERGIQLWTNPGDVVLSPFGGIASEGYQAIKMGRKFIGIELKESYFKAGCANLRMAEQEKSALTLL
jgi:hypothetical protein